MFNIVLVHPKIPQNTGNIGRMCAATDCVLHLVEPLGFEISDSKLKRAGLDYWPFLEHRLYPDLESFLKEHGESTMWFHSAHGTRSYLDADFKEGDFLVFGNEQTGLDDSVKEKFARCLLRIPFDNSNVRSLNLANAVAIVLFEARRQVRV